MTSDRNSTEENGKPHVVETDKTAGITTRIVIGKSDELWEYTARQSRKRLGAQEIPTRNSYARTSKSSFRRIWFPDRIQFWMGVSFMIGASLFFYGSVATMIPQLKPNTYHLNIFPFTGAFFFTSAGFLQWLQASLSDDLSNTNVNVQTLTVEKFQEFTGSLFDDTDESLRFKFLRLKNYGYMSALFQFAGTLAFNINTYEALKTSGVLASEVLVWSPNFAGSVLFMISAQFAMTEVSHGAFSWKPRSVSWWQMFTNYVGSVAFLISAFASFVLPTGDPVLGHLAHLMTAIGAFCFFTGGYLLIPELATALDQKAKKSRTSS
ncbi:MAG: hypothetical protein ABEK59_12755 [Halobacteria archaeon]